MNRDTKILIVGTVASSILLIISFMANNSDKNEDFISDGFIIEENKVEAIYWHEGSRYTAAILDGESLRLHRVPYHGNTSSRVALFTDVKAGEKPWYKCKWKHSGFSGNYDSSCEIHIIGVDSLRTADWSRGKFGSGTTSRID